MLVVWTTAISSRSVFLRFWRVCNTGVLLEMYRGYPDQRIEVRTSVDDGTSWGKPVTVAEKKGSRDGMPGVVRLNDLELLAVFEAQDVPPFRFAIRLIRNTTTCGPRISPVLPVSIKATHGRLRFIYSVARTIQRIGVPCALAITALFSPCPITVAGFGSKRVRQRGDPNREHRTVQ
jgi:hypothetical protein